MSIPVELPVEVDVEQVLFLYVQEASYEDIQNLVLELDNWVADSDFTTELVAQLSAKLK